MEKISNEQVVELLKDAASTVRSQDATIKTLSEKLASMELRERADKIASAMHDKGTRLDTPKEALIDELQKEAGAGRLDAIEAAVELIGPDMWKHARAANNPNSDIGDGAGSKFETYLLGGS